MGFQITEVDAPTTEREPNEFDALLPQVKELADKGKWASVTVGAKGNTEDETAKEVESFKRKFGNAASNAGYSRRFAGDHDNGDGTVLLKFTIRDKITRERKAATADDNTEPTEQPGSGSKSPAAQA